MACVIGLDMSTGSTDRKKEDTHRELEGKGIAQFESSGTI